MDIIENKIVYHQYVRNYLISFIIATVVFWYLNFLWNRRKLYFYSWKVKGPLSFPLIGCAYIFLGDGNEIVKTIMNIAQQIPGLWRIWLGPRLIYCVSKPEYIEKVLSSPKALEKDISYRMLTETLGYGLLTAPAKKWRRQRKLIAPSFHPKILDTFVEVFAEQAVIFSDQLQKVVGQKKFDLYSFASNCTLDIICQTAMGVNMNIQQGDCDFGAILEGLMEILSYRIFRIWHQIGLVWYFSPMKKTFDDYNRRLQSITSAVVSKKMEEYNKKVSLKQSCFEAAIEDEPVNKRMALLDLILENSDMTEMELKEEVNIFLTAGTETTASSICCLFTMLGMHPDIQQKVYDEVMDILGTDRNVTVFDLPKMEYTERVIKENLRLFPIGALFVRTLTEDIKLGDDITLPADSSASFVSVHIHRNPKYWPDPLTFNPDRFLPEEIAKRHPCTYIPFSYGPRNCIGWKYALANLKTIIATVVRRYRIFTEYKSVEEIELKLNLLLRMKDGPKVWIENR